MNLTQHAATADQIAAGVVDLPANMQEVLQTLLAFEQLPSEREIRIRAGLIANVATASEAKTAMIGGAPWLMAPLSAALRDQGIDPVFAFSVRLTEEQIQADGSICKVAVFKHAGFVAAINERRETWNLPAKVLMNRPEVGT